MITNPSPASNAPFPTITPQALAALLEQSQGVDFIDVRTPAEYAHVHARGARLVPLDLFDPGAVAASRITTDRPLYVICKSGGRARKACERLLSAGHPDVCLVEGGTDAWLRAGLPVASDGGSSVISLERQVRIAAGTLVLTGVLLGWQVSPIGFALSALVGAGLVFAGITDTCGMGMLLARCPWNRRGGDDAAPQSQLSSDSSTTKGSGAACH